jgi:DNA mismatch repair protein MLH3
MIIRQLPKDVVDKIKSSVNITSLNGVVCGLIANSLDAGASKVNISIDYARGNCTVEDNGSGIPPDEFKDSGGLGKLHRE